VTVPPAATLALSLALVAERWQIMSPVLKAEGATKPRSVADSVHPMTAGAEAAYGYWLTR
jgi:hypothetical protein